MKLCLKCISLWNSDAEFCGKCRRALGKRCPKGHVNPFISPAVTCIVCNEGPLDGVPYLVLSGLGPLIALISVVFTFQYIWDHHCQVLHLLLHGVLWALATLFDTTPDRIVQGCIGVGNLWVAVFILTLFLPKPVGMRVRWALWKIPMWIAHLIRIAVKVTWQLIKRRVIGTKPKTVQTKRSNHDTDHD